MNTNCTRNSGVAKNVRRKRISGNFINIYTVHGCKAAETGLQVSEPTGTTEILGMKQSHVDQNLQERKIVDKADRSLL